MTKRAIYLCLIVLMFSVGSAYAQVVPGMEDACIQTFGYRGCDGFGHPLAPATEHFVCVHALDDTADRRHSRDSALREERIARSHNAGELPLGS